MKKTFQSFRSLTHNLADLRAMSSILSWDQETMMPSKGALSRARLRATSAAIYHEKLTDSALNDLMNQLEDSDLEFWQRRSLQEMRREQKKALRVPNRLVQELAETVSTAYGGLLQLASP